MGELLPPDNDATLQALISPQEVHICQRRNSVPHLLVCERKRYTDTFLLVTHAVGTVLPLPPCSKR